MRPHRARVPPGGSTPGDSVPANLGPGSPLRSGRDDGYALRASQFSSQNQQLTRHPRESGDPGSPVRGCVIMLPNATQLPPEGANLATAYWRASVPALRYAPAGMTAKGCSGRDDGEGALRPGSRKRGFQVSLDDRTAREGQCRRDLRATFATFAVRQPVGENTAPRTGRARRHLRKIFDRPLSGSAGLKRLKTGRACGPGRISGKAV
jgi:hypothetical protein